MKRIFWLSQVVEISVFLNINWIKNEHIILSYPLWIHLATIFYYLRHNINYMMTVINWELSFNQSSMNPKSALYTTKLCGPYFLCLVYKTDYRSSLWLAWVVRVWYWSSQNSNEWNKSWWGQGHYHSLRQKVTRFILPFATISQAFTMLCWKGKEWRSLRSYLNFFEFCKKSALKYHFASMM